MSGPICCKVFFENGLIGTLAWSLPALALALRLFRTGLASFLWAPVAGLLAVSILAMLDFPFASPAVFFLLLVSAFFHRPAGPRWTTRIANPAPKTAA